jgi:predicted transglutaminase-like cysteine proteinase
MALVPLLSYPVFTPKPSTHHMHNPGSIVPHIRPKEFTDNQMSRIKYVNYYINRVSKEDDDSQWNGTAEDSITPQE